MDVIAHALQDLPLTDQQVDAIRKGGSSFAPTLAVYDPSKPGHRTAQGADQARRARPSAKWTTANAITKKLYDAGISVALGTDADAEDAARHLALHEMELLVHVGLPPSAALIAPASTPG